MKGPGDRLSAKQVLWLDFLTAAGADAEVCKVRGKVEYQYRVPWCVICVYGS